MPDLGLVAVLLGVLIIALRGPLIFAPEATAQFYRRLLATRTRTRIAGLVIGVLGLAVLVTGWGPRGAVAHVLVAVGWLMALGAVFILLAPALYMRLATSVLDWAEEGADPVVARGVGLLAVLLGALLIYWGLTGSDY
jgi:hypothetical protein